MPDMTSRERILQNIRRSTAGASPHWQPQHPLPALPADLPTRFIERAQSLASDVTRINDLGTLPTVVAAYLAAQQQPATLIGWPEFAGLDWLGAGLSYQARPVVDGDSVGLTGCYCGLAETGTLLLASGPDSPAMTSLLPDTHIAVLPLERIVPRMEDAWAHLRTSHPRHPRALNFVSGPSRTGDIEQTITLGAHGPYRVFIVLVG